MKRFLAILVVLFLGVSSAAADDGVFVPSFGSFMESFAAKVKDIDDDLWEAICEECFVDGKWVEPSTYSSNQVYCYEVPANVSISEGNNFLERIKIEIPKKKLPDEETLFKSLMLAAATSIITDADAEFERTFFDNVYYDYTLTSPAGYISMYWNCGVYLFNFSKMSDDIDLEISLSVYEVE